MKKIASLNIATLTVTQVNGVAVTPFVQDFDKDQIINLEDLGDNVAKFTYNGPVKKTIVASGYSEITGGSIEVQPLVYKALITQEGGTVDPTVVVLKNTIGNIVWTRVNDGSYQGTLNDSFPDNKTFMLIGKLDFLNSHTVLFRKESESTIALKTQVGETLADGNLYNVPILIEVYP
jgi:hypothetical protein